MRFSRSRMAVRTRVRGTGTAQRALMTEATASAEAGGRGGGERDGGGEAAALGEEDFGDEEEQQSDRAEQLGEATTQTVHVTAHRPLPSSPRPDGRAHAATLFAQVCVRYSSRYTRWVRYTRPRSGAIGLQRLRQSVRREPFLIVGSLADDYGRR